MLFRSVTLGGYAYLRVFKDGNEISGSPFDVPANAQYIDLTEISAGSYTAYLCNIQDNAVTDLTIACHWTIAL